MTETIAVIGLGQMGLPIAERLLAAGASLTVHNRTAGKAESLVAKGARVATSPAGAVADGVTLVVTMVADDKALEGVTLGDGGLLGALAPGAVHLSMSTVSPETARRLAAAHRERGNDYVAAPVFGRPDAAAAGKLWIAMAGPAAARERAKAVVDAFSQGVYEFGEEPAAANVAKLAGNFLIGAALEAMAEAFALGEKNGLDRTALATLFGDTLFNCPIYRGYGAMIADERYEPAGFRVDLGLKDVRLALAAADASAVPMPLAGLLHDRLLGLLARGHAGLDWSAIGLGVSRQAGLR